MNKVLLIVVVLLVLSGLAFVAYKTLYKPVAPVAVVNPTPTPVADDLKQQLMLTEDDGGQADFKSLDQDASGL